MRTSYVDIVSHFSEEDFYEKYFLAQKPLVIKGLAENCTAGKKWDVNYIKSICGDVMVDIFDSNNKNISTAFTRPDLKMKFSDYIDTIIKGENTTLRMFLFNMFKHKPGLRKDFPCPEMFKGILGKIGFMFFGAKGIKVRIHQDIDMSNVLLTQFHGKKKVVLVSPEYSDFLYRLPFNTYSLIDLDHPDLEKYPGLEFVKTQECILEHGDSLFMPSGYWHYITYLDGGFAVSYRKMAHSLKFKVKGLVFFIVYMPFDKLLHRLFAGKWFAKKEKISETRANKAIKKIKETYEEMKVQLHPNQ